jgi:hypothetical protein
MRCAFAVILAALALTLSARSQDEIPLFKTETASAFVWGEDSGRGTVSSSIRDPATGNAIRKLNHGGIEVSSQAGFERAVPERAGELLSLTTTIVNDTDSELSVGQGRASIDGHLVAPIPVVRTKKGLHKKERNQVWELASLNCFASGFLSSKDLLPSTGSSTVLTVAPKSALTVSFVTKDPRYDSVLCSVDGCFPKGTVRFSVTVNATDFVFIWRGRDMVYCGK